MEGPSEDGLDLGVGWLASTLLLLNLCVDLFCTDRKFHFLLSEIRLFLNCKIAYFNFLSLKVILFCRMTFESLLKYHYCHNYNHKFTGS